MRPIFFPEVNVVAAEHQPEYIPMPVCAKSDATLVACWKMTWRERFKALWTGVVWHEMMTCGQPIQPQRLGIDKPAM